MNGVSTAGRSVRSFSGVRRGLVRTVASAALVGGLFTMGVGGASVAMADTPAPTVATVPANGDSDGPGPIDDTGSASGPGTVTGDADGEMQVQSSKGFKIYNLTGNRLELEGFAGDDTFEGRPDTLSSITPAGQPHDWEITEYYGKLRTTTAKYGIYNAQNQRIGGVDVRMEVNFRNVVWPSSTKSSCENVTAGYTCDAGGQTIKIMESAGSVHNVPAAEAQQQAEVLNTLCAQKSSDVSCRFTSTKRETAYVGWHKVGKGFSNNTDDAITKKITTTETVGVTQGVEVSATAKGNVLGIVEAEVNSKYSQSWQRSSQVSDETNYTIAPGTSFWTESSYPVTRDTGNFTVKIGNSTWNLNNVYFDSPSTNTEDDGMIRYRTGPADTTDIPIRNDGMSLAINGTWGTVL